LPPLTPFTAHVTDVFVDPVTVAVNCFVLVAGTDADVGATVTVTGAAAVTLKFTVLLVVPPSPLLTTLTGTLVPTCAAVAVPVAFSPVGESRVVVSATPPNVTVEFDAKFDPFSEIVNVPTGTEVGEMLQSCTAG
jgi:hypothetical protein